MTTFVNSFFQPQVMSMSCSEAYELCEKYELQRRLRETTNCCGDQELLLITEESLITEELLITEVADYRRVADY